MDVKEDEVVRVKPVAVVHGQIRRDKFFFPCQVNQRRIGNVVLDTGAFDLILSDQIAKQLNLTRHQPLAVRGISGTATAWRSRCNLTVGGKYFRNVSCVIMKDLPYSALFGLRFFIDKGYRLLLDPKNATLSILR